MDSWGRGICDPFFLQARRKIVARQGNARFNYPTSIGLDNCPCPATISQMIQDSDPDVENLNNLMNQMALAFQAIACDAQFISKISIELDQDLNFSIETFLNNNPNYKNIIEQELINQGTTYLDLLAAFTLNGDPMRMIGYAANFGVHLATEVPILALSVELDEVYLCEKSDFIPAYHSISDCNNFTENLLDLVGGLGPRDQSLPTKALTIIFDYEYQLMSKNVVDIGPITAFEGQDLGGASTIGSPNCEPGKYRISFLGVSDAFSKGKKMEISMIYQGVACYTTGWHPMSNGITGEEAITVKKANKSTLVGQGNVLPQAYTVQIMESGNNYQMTGQNCSPSYFLNNGRFFGFFHEHDWYSSKKVRWTDVDGSLVVWKINQKNSVQDADGNLNGVYSPFMVKTVWCHGGIRQFQNNAGVLQIISVPN